MNKKKDTIEEAIESFEDQSFWISERIIFLGSLLAFFIFAVFLFVTEQGNIHLQYKKFIDFFFDSVSVGTLTGLFRGDSGTFTFAGQFVLLADMVFNGLITSVIAVLLIIFVRLGFDRKKSLRKELHKLNLYSKNILLFILIDFFSIWIFGTLLFQLFGSHSLWESLFNSASHILNDGITALPNSMVPYQSNIPMLLAGIFLIMIGGLGVSIRAYCYKHFLKSIGFKDIAQYIPESIIAPKNFMLIILGVSLVLQLFGAVTLYTFENSNTTVFPSKMTQAVKFTNTYYLSVAARTAGFSTIPDLSKLHDKSKYILILLMAIGASSGSFAGGVLKLTAFIYILAYIISCTKGDDKVCTPHNHLHFSELTMIEANFRVIGFTTILIIVLLLLFIVQPNISGLYLIFEGISAVSNTGFTLGATYLLNTWSMLLIILLMVVGKVGFITTVVSFFPKHQLLMEQAKHDSEELPVD
ncbi:MAG TPA: potassium transporter TrkG [Candidatus Acidoferrales bacterium]|nr:potassium transporter TrkG [Candidatus Acidoferrales bacterium]